MNLPKVQRLGDNISLLGFVSVGKYNVDAGKNLPVGRTIAMLVNGILGLNIEIHDRAVLQCHGLADSEPERDLADVRRIEIEVPNPRRAQINAVSQIEVNLRLHA
jgi:hypothetical protein